MCVLVEREVGGAFDGFGQGKTRVESGSSRGRVGSVRIKRPRSGAGGFCLLTKTSAGPTDVLTAQDSYGDGLGSDGVAQTQRRGDGDGRW